MTATNHALTGTLIGLVIGNPLLAIPLAFASHFALDAIPHFGFAEEKTIGHDNFAVLLIVEASLCFLIVLSLGITQPAHWLTAAFSAFAAASPDFMWIPKYLRARRGQSPKPLKYIWWFHSRIQWFQRPIGAFVELSWFLGVGYLVLLQL